MCVQLWQHPGSINTHCMRTKRKTPAVAFVCSGDTRAVECSILTKSQGDPQDNPRESNTETQPGCSAREWHGWWQTHAKMLACRHAGTMQVCTYVRMNCRGCALLSLSRAHSDLIIILPIMLLLALFEKHGRWTRWGESGWIRGNACTETDATINQTEGKTRRLQHQGGRGQEGGNTLGWKVCVDSDAGEQTHTVATALADGKRWSSQVANRALKSRPRDDTWYHTRQSLFVGAEHQQANTSSQGLQTSMFRQRHRGSWLKILRYYRQHRHTR